MGLGFRVLLTTKGPGEGEGSCGSVTLGSSELGDAPWRWPIRVFLLSVYRYSSRSRRSTDSRDNKRKNNIMSCHII